MRRVPQEAVLRTARIFRTTVRPSPVPNEQNATNARGKKPPTAPQPSLSLSPKHICQVFCVNNLTFVSLQYQKCYFMIIGKQIKTEN